MVGGDKRESPDSSAQSKSSCTLRNFMHGNRETSGASVPVRAADRREKAESHTARMHAPEESDLGVVPMKGSNKGGRPTAESLEGRPETKENDLQQHMRPTQCGYRMSQGLRGVRLSRLSALTPSIQGRSRMRESRSYGSVRGVAGDRYPYRDSQDLSRLPAINRVGS